MMEKILLAGLVAVMAVTAVMSQPMASTTEHVLVRCPRVLCDTECEFGTRYDADGCPTCECELSPCASVRCGFGGACVVKQCGDHPCIPYEAECVTEEFEPTELPTVRPTCSPYMCRMYCPFGFRRDENGCEICSCNWTPCESLDCPEGSTCGPYQPDCNEGEICDMQARCVASEVPPAHRNNPDAPVTDEPEMACPLIRCMMACEFGFRKNNHGCEMCDCNPSPCTEMECDDGQVCKTMEEGCGLGEDEALCLRAHCVLQPLCEQQRDVVQQGHLLGQDSWSRGPQRGTPEPAVPPMPTPVPVHGGRVLRSIQDFLGGAPVPSCTEDGHFQPTQCNHVTGNCWCVDDRGIEVPGTRSNQRAEGATLLECPPNRTSALHGRFNLNHDIEDVQNHLENLQELAHEMLSQWLVIARQYVIIVQVSPDHADVHVLQVVFVVHTDENALHDLATSSVHLQSQAFQNNLQMNYQGHVLTPEGETLHVHHQFAPQVSTGLRPSVQTDFYHEHQAALLSCFIGIAFFLVILAVLIKLLVSRRKMGRAEINQVQDDEATRDRYKKNLAFSSKLANMGDEDKKVVLSDAEGMAQEVVA